MERISRQQEFKQGVSEYFFTNRENLLQVPRELTAVVMSRWYRPPEVIVTHADYGKPADIWSMGVVLSELMKCSTVYSKSPEFNPSKRHLFKGKACFPLSPCGNEDVTSVDDQLIKILQRFPKLDSRTDFSFLSDD